MNQQIYQYLDDYKVPRRLNGYGLLARLIELSLEDKGVPIDVRCEQLANETGLSSAKIIGRMRYALQLSLLQDEPAVKRFVYNAVYSLQCAKEG